MSNAIREIAKELPIYRRERAAGLSIPAYLGSKMAVLGVIVAVQAAVARARDSPPASVPTTPPRSDGRSVSCSSSASSPGSRRRRSASWPRRWPRRRPRDHDPAGPADLPAGAGARRRLPEGGRHARAEPADLRRRGTLGVRRNGVYRGPQQPPGRDRRAHTRAHGTDGRSDRLFRQFSRRDPRRPAWDHTPGGLARRRGGPGRADGACSCWQRRWPCAGRRRAAACLSEGARPSSRSWQSSRPRQRRRAWRRAPPTRRRRNGRRSRRSAGGPGRSGAASPRRSVRGSNLARRTPAPVAPPAAWTLSWAEMSGRLKPLAARCDHLAPFALMYLNVSQEVRAGVRVLGTAPRPTWQISMPLSRRSTSTRSTLGAAGRPRSASVAHRLCGGRAPKRERARRHAARHERSHQPATCRTRWRR